MPKQPRYKFPVTVSKLPTVKCALCDKALVVPQGKKSADVLTDHYNIMHSD